MVAHRKFRRHDSSGSYVLSTAKVLCTGEAYYHGCKDCVNEKKRILGEIFEDFSVGVVDSIINWSWDFGDGINSDTINNTVLLYNAPGIYNVCLSVTDVNNCVDTLCSDIIVRPNPIAEFETLSDCYPGCINDVIMI